MHKTVGAKIIVENTNKTYHTYNDWNLVVTNAVPVSDPEQETNFIEVVGRNSLIDVSDALIGRPSYKSRKITIKLAGIKSRNGWDNIVSDLRNKIDGRIIHVIFDHDKQYYFRGRCHIEGFERIYDKGELSLSIPNADPYKYDVKSASEPWEWDPFSFIDGVIRNFGEIVVNGKTNLDIPAGHMYVVPEFQVSTTSNNLTVSNGIRTYNLKAGKNRFPSLLVNGDEIVHLVFEGQGTITIDYRGGSL